MEKTTKTINAVIIAALVLLFCFCCQRIQYTSLWEKHCEACHDGKTVLNGKVVADKASLKEKYNTLDAFANACGNTPMCMNILKHDEKLLRKVGKELELDHIPVK